MARLWRLLVPGCDPAVEIPLPPEEAHHAARVLRLRPGDRVTIFDGAGREWEAELTAPDAARAVRELDDPVECPRAIRLVQGLCRPDRLDIVVQKGTELGLASIAIWTGPRRADAPPPKASRLARWRRIAAEAAKQSGRRVVPDVSAVEALPAPPPGGAGLLLDPGAGEALSTVELDAALVAGSEIVLAVGPESGLDPAEVGAAAAAGWRRVALGPRILRTETAGIVAAALALGRWGDLDAAGPGAI